MKKQSLFLAMLFVTSVLALIGCNKKEDVSSLDKVTVFGTVIDQDSGEQLYNVIVECSYEDFRTQNIKTVASTVTGADGTYEFVISPVDKGQDYVVSVDKAGYEGDDRILALDNVENGKLRCDLLLKKR